MLERKRSEKRDKCAQLPNSKKPWTPEEDDRLRELTSQFGTGNWTVISDNLQERTGKQCRERWHNHLNPGIKKGDWTPDEDLIITSMQKSIGNQWAKITKFLPGRTDNAVKNRFHATVRAKFRGNENPFEEDQEFQIGDMTLGLSLDVDIGNVESILFAKGSEIAHVNQYPQDAIGNQNKIMKLEQTSFQQDISYRIPIPEKEYAALHPNFIQVQGYPFPVAAQSQIPTRVKIETDDSVDNQEIIHYVHASVCDSQNSTPFSNQGGSVWAHQDIQAVTSSNSIFNMSPTNTHTHSNFDYGNSPLSVGPFGLDEEFLDEWLGEEEVYTMDVGDGNVPSNGRIQEFSQEVEACCSSTLKWFGGRGGSGYENEPQEVNAGCGLQWFGQRQQPQVQHFQAQQWGGDMNHYQNQQYSLSMQQAPSHDLSWQTQYQQHSPGFEPNLHQQFQQQHPMQQNVGVGGGFRW